MKKTLVINAGSSTFKIKLFGDQELLFHRLLESLDEEPLKNTLQQLKEQSIDGIGHRVVHGGSLFLKPTLIDADVIKKLHALIPLAPLHNPPSLKGIEIAQKIFPNLPQVAVFDTSFYRNLKPHVKTYPLPYAWKEDGIQRYGFHGINHEYVANEAVKRLNKKDLKLISCHLGNGCSITSIKNGKPLDTTMGFTPLEGLMMGSRSGSIDPGILFYLIREKKYTSQELDTILNKESGLKGIAGSNDMRDILKGDSPQCKLALEMFIYRVRYYLFALLGELGKPDAIIFTGGIGENTPLIRDRIMHSLKDWTDCPHLVIPASEELMIAKVVHSTISPPPA